VKQLLKQEQMQGGTWFLT